MPVRVLSLAQHRRGCVRIAGVMTLAMAAATACSHTYFQFRPSGTRATALEGAAQRFVAAAKSADARALEPALDLEGRRALLELAIHIGRTKTEAGREVNGLFVGVTIALVALARVGEDDQVATGLFEFAERASAPLLARLAEDYGALLPDAARVPDAGDSSDAATSRLSVLSEALARRVEAPDARKRRIVSRAFVEGPLSECAWARKVSYGAGILEHLDDEPSGRTYQAWKGHLHSVHLVVVRCKERDAAVVFTEYDDRESAGLAAWRIMSHEEWARAERRLDEALELK